VEESNHFVWELARFAINSLLVLDKPNRRRRDFRSRVIPKLETPDVVLTCDRTEVIDQLAWKVIRECLGDELLDCVCKITLRRC
jgi:hypothetical protein